MLGVAGQWGRRISLPMTGPSRYWLRNAPGAGKYATVEALIFLYAALGLTAAEAAFGIEDLVAADEAILCSSVAGILPLVEVGGRPIGEGRPGARACRLRDAREAWIVTQSGG